MKKPDYQWLQAHASGITDKDGNMIFPEGKEPVPNLFILFVGFGEWEAIKKGEKC